jgi:hypothetical protein
MGKIFGILLVAIGIWVGLEIYTEGTQNAFGGAFAFLGESSEGDEMRDRRTAPQRAGDAVRSAHGEAEERRNRLLSD